MRFDSEEMTCDEVRERFIEALTAGQKVPDDVELHLTGCLGCQDESRTLASTWEALAALPLLEPSAGVARRLHRRLRREAVREAVTSVESWQRAALAGVAGFVVSVLLSLLVPYQTMVRLCESIAPTSMPTPAAYLMAGVLYGVLPMVLGAAFEARKTAFFGLPAAVEAALVFMVVLVPYVAFRCGEFPAALFVGFVGGIALGAVVGSVAGIKVARQAAWA